MADLKESFLLEIQSNKSRQMSMILARGYLRIERYQQARIAMIRRSLESRRDCYPYTPVAGQIRKRIGLMRGMLVE